MKNNTAEGLDHNTQTAKAEAGSARRIDRTPIYLDLRRKPGSAPLEEIVERAFKKRLTNHLKGAIMNGGDITAFKNSLADLNQDFHYSRPAVMRKVLLYSSAKRIDNQLAFTRRLEKVNYLLSKIDFTKESISLFLEDLKHTIWNEAQTQSIQDILTQAMLRKITPTLNQEEWLAANALADLSPPLNSSSSSASSSSSSSSSSQSFSAIMEPSSTLSILGNKSSSMSFPSTAKNLQQEDNAKQQYRRILLDFKRLPGREALDSANEKQLKATHTDNLNSAITGGLLKTFVNLLNRINNDFSYNHLGLMQKLILHKPTQFLDIELTFERRIEKINYLLSNDSLFSNQDISRMLVTVDKAPWSKEKNQLLREIFTKAISEKPEITTSTASSSSTSSIEANLAPLQNPSLTSSHQAERSEPSSPSLQSASEPASPSLQSTSEDSSSSFESASGSSSPSPTAVIEKPKIFSQRFSLNKFLKEKNLPAHALLRDARAPAPSSSSASTADTASAPIAAGENFTQKLKRKNKEEHDASKRTCL